VWTLQQQMQAIETAWPFGGPFNYIEDVFSTWLYTGNGTSQTITNGINLSGNGGMVWIKDRSISSAHAIFDTVSGATKYVQAQSDTSQNTDATTLTSFNSNGFSIGSNGNVNTNTSRVASWAFRERAKFFDVVSYTGNGSSRTISHNLQSVPGCILIKCTSNVGTSWAVYHRSLANTDYMVLNTTAAVATNAAYWNSTTPTSTTFSLGTNSTVNANGFTYIAYIFAHNAGGFGTSNQDNVISCGSYTGNGATGNNFVSLGYEPQWVLIKGTSSAGPRNWMLFDNMRGIPTGGNPALLVPNLSAAESATANYLNVNATGFTLTGNWQDTNNSGETYIYIAIRRGPMAVPTSATSVFANNIGTDTSAQTTNFPVDMVWDANPGGSSSNISIQNRLFVQYNASSSNTAANAGNSTGWGSNTQITPGIFGAANCIMNSFRRAPKFFDVTTYIGNPSAAFTVYHNLGAIPELLITKCTSTTGEWWVQFSSDTSRALFLNTNAAQGVYGYPFTLSASTTSTLFFNTFGSNIDPCKTGATYIVYLFATLAGISKVGYYTGTGALQTVNCGFTSGARFILIKRMSGGTGDWYVYNSASGISASSDPFMNTNNTSAQTTGTNYVDTDTTGFQLTAAGSATVNVSGAPYIFLAIA
jgi:hypothetical protein